MFPDQKDDLQLNALVILNKRYSSVQTVKSIYLIYRSAFLNGKVYRKIYCWAPWHHVTHTEVAIPHLGLSENVLWHPAHFLGSSAKDISLIVFLVSRLTELFVSQATHGQRPWPTWCSGGLPAPSQPPSSCLTAKTLWTPLNWFTRRSWTDGVWGVSGLSRFTWLSKPTVSWSAASFLPSRLSPSEPFSAICLQHVSLLQWDWHSPSLSPHLLHSSYWVVTLVLSALGLQFCLSVHSKTNYFNTTHNFLICLRFFGLNLYKCHKCFQLCIRTPIWG